MTALLQKAFEKVSQLPIEQQEALASMIMRMAYYDPEHGPIFRLSEKEFERLNMTSADAEEVAKELGLYD